MISATESSGIVSHAPITVSPAARRALNRLTRLPSPRSCSVSSDISSAPPCDLWTASSLRHGRGHGQLPGCLSFRAGPLAASGTSGAAWHPAIIAGSGSAMSCDRNSLTCGDGGDRDPPVYELPRPCLGENRCKDSSRPVSPPRRSCCVGPRAFIGRPRNGGRRRHSGPRGGDDPECRQADRQGGLLGLGLARSRCLRRSPGIASGLLGRTLLLRRPGLWCAG